MIPRLKALIFDFEGTLVDFQWRLAEAEAEAGQLLAELGVTGNKATEVHYAEAMNMALQHSEGTGLGQAVLALSAIYDRYDQDALMRWQVRPGVLEILPMVRAMGFKTALVSNVGEKSLKAALFRLGLNDYLEVIISRNEARWLKPHPKGIELACERLGCHRDEVCFLGDSMDDIRAAQRAGVPVIILAGGQDDLQKIQEGRPDGILEKWDELPLFLKQKDGLS
ncbi:MAG: HAD family hydrolase [Thermodesulfobacteriota bacterium]